MGGEDGSFQANSWPDTLQLGLSTQSWHLAHFVPNGFNPDDFRTQQLLGVFRWLVSPSLSFEAED